MNLPLISEYVDAIRSAIARIHKTFVNVLSRLLAVVKPQKPEIKVIEVKEELSTKVTKENLKDAVEDEFGAKYSRDGKRLLDGKGIKEGIYIPNYINP